MRSFSTYFLSSLLGLLLTAGCAWAQAPQQVILVNGGQFGTGGEATVASFNPNTGNYFLFDSIPAGSVQDVLVDGQYAYVAADSIIRKYDLDTYTEVSSTICTGVRKLTLAPNQGHLVATRGFGASSDYVRIYEQSDLSDVASVANISGECEGLTVVNDTAYVAVQGGFGVANGKIALINLDNQSLIAEVDLDTMGRSIHSIFFDPTTNDLLTLNPLAFGSPNGAISRLSLGSRNATSIMMTFSVDYGPGTALINDQLFGQFDGGFNNIQLNGIIPYTLGGNPSVSGSWAASAIDQINNIYYLSRTDYSSWGSLHRYDASGNLIDTIAVGISPEAFDIDARVFTAQNELFSDEIFIQTFPNPFTDKVTVDASRLTTRPEGIEVYNLEGRLMSEHTSTQEVTEIDLSNLSAGNYFLIVRTVKGNYAQRIVRH